MWRLAARVTRSSQARQRYLSFFGCFLAFAAFFDMAAVQVRFARIHVVWSCLAFLSPVKGLRRPSTKVVSSATATSIFFAAFADATDHPRAVMQTASRASSLVRRRGMKENLQEGLGQRAASGLEALRLQRLRTPHRPHRCGGQVK